MVLTPQISGMKRSLCGICAGYYWRNRAALARHLESRRHRAACAAARLPYLSEDPLPSVCELCGGSSASRGQHVWSARHREAATRLGLNHHLTELPR